MTATASLPLAGLLWIGGLGMASAHAGDCLDRAQNQVQIDACAASDFAAADRELNAVYARVQRDYAHDAAFLGKLRLAQRAWIAFRDAELAARYPDADPATAYGSAYPGCAAGVKAELTRARTTQLERWLDGAAEGEVCAGSVRPAGAPD
ncbi:lysozyme inhibitor LprI family protein [Dokdonella koreensis]|uniref:Lysozyme inhibitor LprI-like N-terminal domain-containing protein n=1 Tax=Dokdonella koreensis DS-123 TaxID=1300342 RepID=A0A160DUZ1_9GAMM|nr:lysozyme inhibitor LprI family protein [Dokdonella koreensis]ANB17881.1 Hypothetical protein I596_1858 [Dokdonella koreensis DS-123]